jgi:hypothetical protein
MELGAPETSFVWNTRAASSPNSVKRRVREMLAVGLMGGMFIVWAVLTGMVIVLSFYRSMLGGRDKEQLFLSQPDELMAREHEEVVSKEKKVGPILYTLATVSAVLLLSIVGLWLWRGLLRT